MLVLLSRKLCERGRDLGIIPYKAHVELAKAKKGQIMLMRSGLGEFTYTFYQMVCTAELSALDLVPHPFKSV